MGAIPMKNQKYFFVFSLLATFTGCLYAAGPGQEPPKSARTTDDGTGGGGTSSSASLPDYTSSGTGPTLALFEQEFLAAAIYGLTVDQGPSGPGYISVSMGIDDPGHSASGCTAVLRFIRDSSDTTTAVRSDSLTTAILDSNLVQFSEMPLTAVGLPGGSFLAAVVYAYIECGDGRTSNIQKASFAQ
jgi:hypothetical protein